MITNTDCVVTVGHVFIQQVPQVDSVEGIQGSSWHMERLKDSMFQGSRIIIL